MSLMFRGGYCEVRYFKEGMQFTKDTNPELFNSISSVRTKVRAGNVSSITIEITPSFQDGLTLLKSGLLGTGISAKGQTPPPDLQPSVKAVTSKDVNASVAQPLVGAPVTRGAVGLLPSNMPSVAVRYSYPDETTSDGSPAITPWYTAILGPPDLNFEGKDMTITLHGNFYPGLLQSIEGTISFSNVTALEAITQLASPLNLAITFDEGDSETQAMLTTTLISGIYNEPRLTTIKSILYKCHCEFVTHTGDGALPTNELRIKSMDAQNKGKIDYTFVLWRQIDPANNIVPILGFHMDSAKQLFLKGSAFGSYQAAVDPATKTATNITVGPGNTDKVSLTSVDSQGGALPQDTSGGSTNFPPPSGLQNASDPNLAGRSDHALTRGAQSNLTELQASTKSAVRSFLQFELTVNGLPDLRPMSVGQVIVEDNVPGLTGPGIIPGFEHLWDAGNVWTTVVTFRQSGSITAAASFANFNARPLEAPEKKSVGTAVTPTVVPSA